MYNAIRQIKNAFYSYNVGVLMLIVLCEQANETVEIIVSKMSDGTIHIILRETAGANAGAAMKVGEQLIDKLKAGGVPISSLIMMDIHVNTCLLNKPRSKIATWWKIGMLISFTLDNRRDKLLQLRIHCSTTLEEGDIIATQHHFSSLKHSSSLVADHTLW